MRLRNNSPPGTTIGRSAMTYVFPYYTAIYTAVLGLLAALLTVKPFVSLKNFTLPVTLTCSLRMSNLCYGCRCKAPSLVSRRAKDSVSEATAAKRGSNCVGVSGGRSFARPACA